MLPALGAFLPSFSQNTPNLYKLGAFICDKKKNPIDIPKYAKRPPKRQTHIRKPCQCEYPPPPPPVRITVWLQGFQASRFFYTV